MVEEEIQDVGDAPQVKRRRSKQKIKREGELEEIRQILNTSFGRRFLWRFLSECGLFHTMSHHSKLGMAIGSGKRDMGLWLISEINIADKSGYLKLIQEDLKDVA